MANQDLAPFIELGRFLIDLAGWLVIEMGNDGTPRSFGRAHHGSLDLRGFTVCWAGPEGDRTIRVEGKEWLIRREDDDTMLTVIKDDQADEGPREPFDQPRGDTYLLISPNLMGRPNR